MAFAIEIVHHVALDVGVIALFFFVFNVVRGDFLDELLDLILTEESGSGWQRRTSGLRRRQ